jgi:hypothetical protein
MYYRTAQLQHKCTDLIRQGGAVRNIPALFAVARAQATYCAPHYSPRTVCKLQAVIAQGIIKQDEHAGDEGVDERRPSDGPNPRPETAPGRVGWGGVSVGAEDCSNTCNGHEGVRVYVAWQRRQLQQHGMHRQESDCCLGRNWSRVGTGKEVEPTGCQRERLSANIDGLGARL